MHQSLRNWHTSAALHFVFLQNMYCQFCLHTSFASCIVRISPVAYIFLLLKLYLTKTCKLSLILRDSSWLTEALENWFSSEMDCRNLAASDALPDTNIASRATILKPPNNKDMYNASYKYTLKEHISQHVVTTLNASKKTFYCQVHIAICCLQSCYICSSICKSHVFQLAELSLKYFLRRT